MADVRISDLTALDEFRGIDLLEVERPLDGGGKASGRISGAQLFSAPVLVDLLAGKQAASEVLAAIAELDLEEFGAGLLTLENAAALRVVAAITAALVPSDPTGDVAATNVQAAIAELASEKLAKAGGTMTGILTPWSRTLAQMLATPPAAAGWLTCADLGGGAGPVYWDGARYQRLPYGSANYSGTASVTLAYLTSAPMRRMTGSGITSNRTATLDANVGTALEAPPGAVLGVANASTTIYAWSLGGLIDIPNGHWAQARWTGSAWELSAKSNF